MRGLLVSCGAKVARLNNSGKSALHLALIRDDRDMISYLTKQWADQGYFDSAMELLYVALDKGYFRCARNICNAYNPEKYNMGDLEELYRTAIEGAFKTFPAILQQRAGDTDRMWLTGLFRVAIRSGNLEILRALINQNVDVNERDLLGTALYKLQQDLDMKALYLFYWIRVQR